MSRVFQKRISDICQVRDPVRARASITPGTKKTSLIVLGCSQSNATSTPQILTIRRARPEL